MFWSGSKLESAPPNAKPPSSVIPSTIPRSRMTFRALVRARYGINYNTAAYQNIVQNMAFQPPFSNTQTNVASPTNILTLQNGFPTTTSVTNNYGIDPNYGHRWGSLRRCRLVQ